MKKFISFLLLFSFGLYLFAAEPLLIYFLNRSGRFRIIEPGAVTKNASALKIGMNIKVGSTIITEKGDTAEIQLPNGSIIRLSENTNFTILAIQGEKGAVKNEFDLQIGKFRSVVGKVTGDEQYSFRSRTAVCGVRGTDLGMETLADPAGNGYLPPRVFVFDGTIDVSKLDEAGKILSTAVLKSGEWLDFAAAVFKPQKMTADILNNFKKGLEFEKLDPNKVPGHTRATSMVDPSLDMPKEDTALEGQTTPTTESDWLKAVREFIGLEIGSVIIGNQTYGKVVLSPKIKFDNFKLALYLPIVYQSDMFNPADWYHPAGNNEWSFGTDADFGDNWGLRIGDAVHDLVLKIKGLEINNLRDPFYLKLGSLSSFTIGHGMIVCNYANDSDFPATRKVGFQLGLDTGPFGMELLLDDLGTAFKLEPDILGTRLYFRPMHPTKFAIGLSLITDLNPAQDVPNLGDPIFFNAGLDFDFPIFESDFFSLIMFSDFALLLPYFRSEVPGANPIPAGFAFNAIMHGEDGNVSFKNFGIAAGFLGNISFFDWRLELRYYTGMFKPAIFNSGYDRKRLDYVNEIIYYLQNPTAYENNLTTFGIYAEGGFTLEKILSFSLGYLCPLAFGSEGLNYGTDYLKIKFSLEKNVIPLIGIFGSISYERNNFVKSFAGGLPELFDENTVIKTKIGYPIVEGLNIILHYTTTFIRDPMTGTPTFNHALTFETVIDF